MEDNYKLSVKDSLSILSGLSEYFSRHSYSLSMVDMILQSLSEPLKKNSLWVKEYMLIIKALCNSRYGNGDFEGEAPPVRESERFLDIFTLKVEDLVKIQTPEQLFDEILYAFTIHKFASMNLEPNYRILMDALLNLDTGD